MDADQDDAKYVLSYQKDSSENEAVKGFATSMISDIFSDEMNMSECVKITDCIITQSQT